MDHQTIHVITIANSIIGVSILAMPYCFKQCGILLSILILIISSIISRLSCHLLLKSAIMARRRTFEFLAFHAFGPLGKFVIEIGLIGFLLGTCIAFFVVMGDLAPAIVAKMTDTRASDTLRTSILMALGLFCVLPLGLLRNIDSLSSVCMATVGFYFCLVLKIVAESAYHIFSSDWVNKVELWRPAGILQCLPIFSMALFCQTQIFEIYQAIPNASLEKMNNLIRMAVNICTGVYIFVGVFGYIAFCGQSFGGNILMSFPTSLMSEVMKIGFVLSVAFSFPLIIFPCRASMYSLLYKRTYSMHEGTDKYIPEGRFKGLTFVIVFVSLVTGVMIPNIELVLGLVGSTIGIVICVLFPAMCFICISTKNTNERILAQLMLFIGVIVMVLGTYANLYAMEEIAMNPPIPITEKAAIIPQPDILKLVQEDPALKVMDIPLTTKSPVDWKHNKEKEKLVEESKKLLEVIKQESVKEIRHEPPQPEAPPEAPKEAQVEETKAEIEPAKDSNLEKPIEQPEDKKAVDDPIEEVKQPIQLKDINLPDASPKVIDVNIKPTIQALNTEKSVNIQIKKIEVVDQKANNKKVEEVDIEAIKKEDKELFEQEKEKLKEEEKKNLDLIKSLERHNEEQKKLVEDSKKLLEEIKQRQEALKQDKQQKEIDQVKEEKIKAVSQIELIAKKAIEKLSGADQPNQDSNAKETDFKNVLNSGQLPPLPIAMHNNLSEVYKNLAKMDVPKSQNNITDVQPAEEKPIEIKKEEPEKVNLLDVLRTKAEKVTNLEKQEKLIQHREIRSVQEQQLELVPNDVLEKNDKEDSCDKDKKLQIGSTEAPLLRMITRLSEPELVSFKLPDLDTFNVDSVLKPLKRDLKSYKGRRRK